MLLSLLLMAWLCPSTVLASADWPDNVSIESDAGIIMDANSGAVIYGKNIHATYAPASITKVLTALIVLERCSMDETVTFSQNAVYNVESNSSSAGYDTGDTGKMRIDRDEKGRIHGKYVEIYGRRGSLMYNTKGEPLSIHVFMNTLLKFEGIVYQVRCIQWGEKEYELLVNADRTKLNVEELLAAYRHYLGEDAEIRVTYVEEIPIQASGKFMVCENKWDGRK